MSREEHIFGTSCVEEQLASSLALIDSDSYVPEAEEDLDALIQALASDIMGTADVRPFDDVSVRALFAEEAWAVLRPTLHVKRAARQRFGARASLCFDSDPYLLAIVLRRFEMLRTFLKKASIAWTAFRSSASLLVDFGAAQREHNPIRFLAGESHNGCMRPILVDCGDSRAVLKFAEPRSYSLLSAILQRMEECTGIDILQPAFEVDAKSRWCVIEFLDEGPPGRTEQIECFMHSYGVLTATAYCLRMVDIHLENVVVHNALPVIVDPECILYIFDDIEPDDRLLSTGFLSCSVPLASRQNHAGGLG